MKASTPCILAVFAFSLLSCKNDTNGDEKSTLHVMVKKSDADLELFFTGDDIFSFNVSTEEIVFADAVSTNLTGILELQAKLSIYLNDQLLIDNISIWSPLSSWIYNDLVFVWPFFERQESKFHLVWGMPSISDLWLNADEMRREREENFLKRKKDWDIFIQYLKDTDKLTR